MSDLVEKARELSRWLVSTDADMRMPEGMIHPEVLADEITRLRAEVERFTRGNNDMRHTIHQWEPERQKILAENAKLRAALLALKWWISVRPDVFPEDETTCEGATE